MNSNTSQRRPEWVEIRRFFIMWFFTKIAKGGQVEPLRLKFSDFVFLSLLEQDLCIFKQTS